MLLWKTPSTELSVEVIYHTRICRTLNYAKDFFKLYMQEIDACQENFTSDVYPRIRERAFTLADSLQNILDKLRNFVFTCIFQQKDMKSSKEIAQKMKGAIKLTVKNARLGFIEVIDQEDQNQLDVT